MADPLAQLRIDFARLLFDSAGRIVPRHIAEPGALLNGLLGIVAPLLAVQNPDPAGENYYAIAIGEPVPDPSWAVACPDCGAPRLEACFRRDGSRSTVQHGRRWQAFDRACDAGRNRNQTKETQP
jgi:hypothetical protein